jgi:hypothetical protein
VFLELLSVGADLKLMRPGGLGLLVCLPVCLGNGRGLDILSIGGLLGIDLSCNNVQNVKLHEIHWKNH